MIQQEKGVEDDFYSQGVGFSRGTEGNTMKFSCDKSNVVTDSLFIGSIYVGLDKVELEKN